MRGEYRSLMASKRPIFPTRKPVVARHIGRGDLQGRLARLWRRASLVLAKFIGTAALCPLATRVDLFHDFDQPVGKLPGGLIHPRISTTEQWSHLARVGNEPEKFAVNASGTDPMQFVAFWVVQIEAGLQCSQGAKSNRIADQISANCGLTGTKAPKPRPFLACAPFLGPALTNLPTTGMPDRYATN